MTSIEPAPHTARDVLASLPRQDRHKPKCGPVRKSKTGRWRAWSLIAVHVVVGLHFLHWGLTGTSVSPVEPSESMEAFELGKVNAGFLLFAALIASTLLFGRWFCGWACHVVALQDLSAWLLGKLGLKPRPVRSRLLVLAPWVVAGHMFLWPHVEHWLDPVQHPLPDVASWRLQVMSDDLWRTFPGWIMAPATLLVVGFLIVWWLGAKGFCTYGCPYGAFFAVADRVAPVRIKVTDACDACGHCTSVCSSNVRVHEEVAVHGKIVDPGCMKCLDCVSVCPKDALYVGFAAPKPFATSRQRVQARADFTWLEEILMGLVAFVAAQWTFRGAWFGEGVPLLMAVGLGVITAVFAMLAWRLVRRSDVTFQHTALKQQRRFTSTGRWVAAGIALWLGFAAHTFVGQRLRSSAIATSEAPLRQALHGNAQGDPVELQRSLDSVDRALGWQLIEEPFLLEVRGLLLIGLQRFDEAENALRDALGGREHLAVPEANLALAMIDMNPQRPNHDEAERLLRHMLAVDPGNQAAAIYLEQLQRLRGR
jgi:polyferredoxin